MSASESDSSTEKPVCTEKHYRRRRTIITPDQLVKLETAFKSDPWPVRSQKEELAKDLGKSEVFVSTWFQNKRARVRRTDELHRTKPPSVTEDCIKTVSVEDRDGNKYLKIVRVSPGEAFGKHVSRISVEPVDVMKRSSSENVKSEKSSHARALDLDLLMQTEVDPPALNQTPGKTTTPVAMLIPHDQEKRTHVKTRPASLFYSIIDMMAMAEGGIINAVDPEYSSAVSNALYGILINGKSRITYDKVSGLEVLDFEGHGQNS